MIILMRGGKLRNRSVNSQCRTDKRYAFEMYGTAFTNRIVQGGSANSYSYYGSLTVQESTHLMKTEIVLVQKEI